MLQDDLTSYKAANAAMNAAKAPPMLKAPSATAPLVDWAGADEEVEAPVARVAVERVVVASVSIAMIEEKVWVELENPPTWEEDGAAVALMVELPAAVALADAEAEADIEPPL